MRIAYNRSNENIEEKEIEYKPDNLIMVSRRNMKMSCLKCGKIFLSEGPYNRICAKCNVINKKERVTRYPVIVSFAELADNVENGKYARY